MYETFSSYLPIKCVRVVKRHNRGIADLVNMLLTC